MDGVSSVQTTVQTINVPDEVKNSNQDMQQTLTYEHSLSVQDSSKSLEINLSDSMQRNDVNTVEKLMQGVAEMDSDYNGIMGRLNSWPDFKSYLSKSGLSTQSQLNQDVGITHISNVDELERLAGAQEPESIQSVLDTKQEKIEALQKEQQAYYSAGVEYSKDSTLWSMNSTFWLSKIKILTSAVSEVSSGLKTLFMSQ